MIKTITQFFATKCGLTVGTNIFAGARPDNSPDECDVVQCTGGEVGFSVPDQILIEVHVICRAKSVVAAERRAYAIHNVMSRLYAGWPMPVVSQDEKALRLDVIQTMTAPAYIGIDARGLFEYSINYVCRFSNQAGQ